LLLLAALQLPLRQCPGRSNAGSLNPLLRAQRRTDRRFWVFGEVDDEHPQPGPRHRHEVYFATTEIELVSDDPGPTLFDCHHQDSQDEGLMGLITYAQLRWRQPRRRGVDRFTFSQRPRI
jgi:hypothetical protein